MPDFEPLKFDLDELELAPLADQRRHLRRLDQAMRASGVIQIRGSALGGADVNVRAAARRFFALPNDQKAGLQISNRQYRGWIDGSTERGAADIDSLHRRPDQKEVLTFARLSHVASQIKESGWRAANRFPSSVPELEPCVLELMESLAAHMSRLSAWLDAALAEAGSDPIFRALSGNDLDALNVNYYHASLDEGRSMNVGAHVDFGLLTLLQPEPKVPQGLQVKSGKAWETVRLDDGYLLLLAGELSQIYTHNRWHAGLHRVIPTAGSSSRVSLVYFRSPAPATRLPADYAGVERTAGEHLTARLTQLRAA